MQSLIKLLSLLLLLMTAQQGAVVHELSHVIRADSGMVRTHVGKVADSTCTLCPAFAQVATPAFSHSFHTPSLVLIATQRIVELRVLAIDADVPHPRSRGPPSLS